MMHSSKEEINSCKTLALHNLQPVVTPGLFKSYLQAANIRYPISKVYRNSQHLPLLVEFPNNCFAKRFYDQFNFKKGICDNLFIISFDLKLDKQQLKQYELKGTTQTNLRQVFQLARKKSICEISINYESSQPDSAALLTFLRELSLDEQREFFSELSKLGVRAKETQAQKQQTGGWWQTCKKIVISNMQNDIYHKNAFDFLEKNDMLDMAKQFSVNRKHKAIKIEFHLPLQALNFYIQQNFNQKIESRPINIFFDISLPQTQMKRYQIQGVTEKNLRTIFELASQIEICKLQLSYGPDNNTKLESKAQIIFFSKKEISKHKISFLAKKLQQFGVLMSKQPPNVVKQQLIPILKVQESVQINPVITNK